MNKVLLLALLLIYSQSALASHIVGGELELNRIDSSYFNIKLHLYSDNINGDPGAIDYYATVYMFRKTDNVKMPISIGLNLTSIVPVNYTNVECEDERLSTSHVIYERYFYLDTTQYTDPEGYYFAYERCCRNQTIVNIHEPEASGQTFYLEFPSFSVINSSPSLFPPLSDYACVGTPFNFDFSATDPDNDSLVYSLTTPLRGSSSVIAPAPQAASAPYRLVSWLPDYSESYQISGTQTLNIDRKSGELSLIPDRVGLFVFAVKCQEYRNGIKIGEVRREFQLLVLDCPSNEKPDLSFINPGTKQTYVPGDTIILTENQNSFDFTVRDSDLNDKLKIEAKGINAANTQVQLSLNTGTVNSSNNPTDSLNSTLQLDTEDIRCQDPFSVLLVVKDNACSIPASDGVTIFFKYEGATPNRSPVLSINTPADTIELVISQDSIEFEVSGIDPDNDSVQIRADVNGKAPAEYGMHFIDAEGIGEVKSIFSWKPGCEAMDIDGYQVNFIINDVACKPYNFDTTSIYLKLRYQNLPPVLKVNTAADTITVATNKDPISFEVSGRDTDAHTVQIKAEVNGMDPTIFDMSFPPLEALAEVKGRFSWSPGCNALTPGEYKVNFIINDVMCRPDNFDTISVVIKVIEDNTPAILYTSDETVLNADIINKIQLGSNVQLKLFGEDIDPTNRLTLTAQGIGFDLASLGMSFPETTGNSLTISNFNWNSSCEHQDFLYKPLQVEFNLNEQTCITSDTKTLVYTFELIDTVTQSSLPYNVLTPNGDGKNEYFSLEEVTLETCIGMFEFVEIYNRWGTLIFKDDQKDFRWTSEGFKSGTYYYYIKFNNRDFRGWVTLLK
jgi:gliding motility-associated-like protein